MCTNLIGIVLLSMLEPSLWFDRERSFYQTLAVERFQLEVSVFDERGRPVLGLDKSDFEVLVDGHQEPIELVEQVVLDNQGGNAWAAIEHRRLFVMIFDLKYTTVRGVLEARRAAMHFVRQDMRSYDLLAVITVEPQRGFRLISNFTDDHAQLLRALNDLGLSEAAQTRLDSHGYFRVGALGQDLRHLQQSGQVLTTTPFDDHLEGDTAAEPGLRATLANEAINTLKAILEMSDRQRRRGGASDAATYLQSFALLGQALNQIRGQKNVILFSAGVDSSLLVGGDPRQLVAQSERSVTGNRWEVDSDHLGSGALSSHMADVIQNLRESGAMVYAIDTSHAERSRRRNHENHGLNMLAADTGGRVFRNQNRYLEPLRRIDRAASAYYILTLAPEGNWDDVNSLPVKIKVRNQRRARVVSSSRLTLHRPFESLSQLARQFHFAEFAGKAVTAYEIPVRVNQMPLPQGKGMVRLLVELEIGGQYFEDDLASGETRDIEFFVRAFDIERGMTYDTVSSQYRLNLAKAGQVIEQSGVKYFASLLVRPGKYKLVMVVRDLESGRVGSLLRWVDVPDRFPRAIATLLADTPWITLHGSRDFTTQNFDLSYPLRMNDRVFIPDSLRKIRPAESAHFFYLVNANDAHSLAGGTLFAQIRDEAGVSSPIPASALRVDYGEQRVASFLPVLLRLDMSQLKLTPGDYSLLTEFRNVGDEPILSLTKFSL